MTNDEYMQAVESGNYPDDIVVPLDTPFVNGAGEIQNIVLGHFTTGTIIHSKARSVRSNHYHMTDFHFMYVLTGIMWYFWRPMGSKEQPKKRAVLPGEVIFTPPMVVHGTYFPCQTTILTFSKNPRDHVSHESDLARVKFIESLHEDNMVKIWFGDEDSITVQLP